MKNRHDHLTNLINMIEKAEGIWELPWRRGETRPVNLATGRPYRGINTINLIVSQWFFEYETPYWLTYKQAQSQGGQVRKGERGTKILFYRQLDETEKPDQTQRFVTRYSTVFNFDQIDNVSLPELPQKDNSYSALTKARAFCESIPVPVIHDGSSAFYSPGRDEIHMPSEDSFFDTKDATGSEHYVSTLLHEMVHATGHKSRLDRFPSEFSRENRAREELVADIGSALLGIDLGVSASIRNDHAEYLAHWKSFIKDDPKCLQKAATQAERAIDWLFACQTKAEAA